MLRTASLRAAHQLLDRPPVLVAALARRAGLLVATESASPPIAARQQTSLNVREAPRDLYGLIDVKASNIISLFDGLRSSPRPDLIVARLLRAATVKGGRRPSRSDLSLTVASTAADFVGSGRW